MPEATTPIAVARVFSLVGHPFVVLPLTITLALIGKLPPAKLIGIIAIFLLATILPLLFIIRRRVRAGTWTDMDVSDHGQRGGLYTVALPILIGSIVLFWVLGFPRGIIVGAIVSLGLLLAGMAINRYSKISMHAMFGAYCVVILLASNLVSGLVGLVLLAGMSWSRVVLGRHTVLQVIAGNLLGAAAGILLLWIL